MSCDVTTAHGYGSPTSPPRNASVIDWLQSVEADAEPDPSAERDNNNKNSERRGQKRAALQSYPSPSSEMSAPSDSPATKRRRRDDPEDSALDETPRQRAFSATDSTRSETSSTASRTSSPTKQLRRMQVHEHGFVVGKLLGPSTATLAPSLARLVSQVELLSQGIGVVPAARREELRDSATSYGIFGDHVFGPAPSDLSNITHTLSHLSLAKVKAIVDRANLCELRMEDEASWNMEVHHHILRAVCRPHGFSGLVDFMSCTTAKISPYHRPRHAPHKMVDFCLVVNPSDAASIQRIDRISREQPDGSINHTDYAPLCRLPLSVSIETKRSAHHWETATLQMGTWQAAQLRATAGILGGDGVAPRDLDYLPGLIVQGHDWNFVATVDQDGQKALLTKISIGSTETVLGAYKVLAVVSLLKNWTETVFWAAFQDAMHTLHYADPVG